VRDDVILDGVGANGGDDEVVVLMSPAASGPVLPRLGRRLV